MKLRTLLVIGSACLPACGSDSDERSSLADAAADVLDSAAADAATDAADATTDTANG